MNREWIAFHLRDAKEQIEQTLGRLDDLRFTENDLRYDIQHALHHLHTAYNSRHVKDTSAITYEQFLEHQRPPADMEWD